MMRKQFNRKHEQFVFSLTFRNNPTENTHTHIIHSAPWTNAVLWGIIGLQYNNTKSLHVAKYSKKRLENIHTQKKKLTLDKPNTPEYYRAPI